MVPPVAVQVTALLKLPVPTTFATQVEVCVGEIDAGFGVTVIEVMVTGAVTAMLAVPETLVNPACVELAVQVPVPAADGVKTPPAVMVPPVAVHVTALLKAPVPLTVATQVAVCAVVMEDGVATTETPVTVSVGAVTAMLAVPETLVNPACVECAVQVPVPAADGVKTPPAVMVPPVAVHVTALLNAPVPLTVAT